MLPYREIDQSGVLYAALAFGTPLLLSDVGGFPEVAGARLVEPGDAAALHAALLDLPGPPQPAAVVGRRSDSAPGACRVPALGCRCADRRHPASSGRDACGR